MEEAVEICKLRLFLKLAAQVDPDTSKPNFGIEPLPDIDFNIRAGNTLVGFAALEQIKEAITTERKGKATQKKLLQPEDIDTIKRIEEKAQDVDRLFALFRQQQTELGGEVTTADKQELKKRLKVLEEELNRYLASEYGISQNNFKNKQPYEKKFLEWLTSHKPFHWFIEFHAIMKDGGFDVIIGNPPYVEYSKVKKEYTILGYQTEDCGNLYAYAIERSYEILGNKSRFGMIVQLPLVCTDRMKPLQRDCLGKSLAIWFANFDDRPARLFEGLEHIRATIVTAKKGKENYKVFSTNYNRWYSEIRTALFESIFYEETTSFLTEGSIPKIGSIYAKSIMERLTTFDNLGNFLILQDGRGRFQTCPYTIYFHNAPQYWIRAMDFAPYFWNERDGEQISGHVKSFNIKAKIDAFVTVAILNSSLFYWWFILLSNCRDLTNREIENFPIGLDKMADSVKQELSQLSKRLMEDLKQHKQRKECQYKATGKVVYDEFYPKYSKPIIDEIDSVLARHYGVTDEELDFIINYDIKYRMGRDTDDDT
ncbi:MAG: hypothetical protein CV087_02260 [Candidatus Brocadia sp. WS118]|nr:MAG: hypothetical protein CV087_02260 [Candidatus Brocadia sp. WS118]